jgi:hypothetical protein
VAVEFILSFGLRAFERAKALARDTAGVARSARDALRDARRDAAAAGASVQRAAASRAAGQAQQRAAGGPSLGGFSQRLGGLRGLRGDAADVLGAGRALAQGDAIGAVASVAGRGGLVTGAAALPAALAVGFVQLIRKIVDDQWEPRVQILFDGISRQFRDEMRTLEQRIREDRTLREKVGKQAATDLTETFRNLEAGGWTPASVNLEGE